jgi:glycerol-3-phosphate O-acyltransferase
VWCVHPKQHLTAAVYRNSAIHVLVSRAIVELVLVGAADGDSPDDADPRRAWDDALRLRDLLKFEFFFPSRRKFAEDLHAELVLISPNLEIHSVNLTTEQAREYVRRLRMPFAHLVLRPFIDAYWVVATQLLELGTRELDEQRFIGQCLQVGRQWALQRQVASLESVSAEMFRTALRLAGHRGLVDPGTPDLTARRQEFVDEILDVRRRIQEISQLAARPNDPIDHQHPRFPDSEDVSPS